jgi:hypothetical protein
MRFSIKTWVSTADIADTGTLFGILNAEVPGVLPVISGGHWEDYSIINDGTFRLAEEAKNAINRHGYYLLGAVQSPADTFGIL